MPDDAPSKDAPFFTTPLGFVALSIVLWVLSCVAAAAAVMYTNQADFSSSALAIAITYLAFAPATILVILSLVTGIVGAIRWALFGRSAPRTAVIDDRRTTGLLDSINQRLLLSETAKKIAYRGEDIRVLHQTIRDDIRTGSYDEAMVLVSELGSTYGQLEEAEAFRGEIDKSRTAAIEEKVKAGIASLDETLSRHEFAEATKEAARLRRLYPESPAVQRLDERVVQAREQYKKDLERELLKAAGRDEVDRAIELLKELDTYLSPEEAAPFQEVARGVIGKKRDNLGVQFKMAVHDKEWTAAVMAGEQIIREFPNSRMADEVRSMIDLLRERSAGQQQANQAVVAQRAE